MLNEFPLERKLHSTVPTALSSVSHPSLSVPLQAACLAMFSLNYDAFKM